VYKKTFFGYPNNLLVILKWCYMRVLHLRLGLHIRFALITYGLFQYELTCMHCIWALVFIQRRTQTIYWVFQSDLACGYCILRLPFRYRFYFNHLWVILKWTWIWLLHLGLRFHIILQYPHTYLFSSITNLALIFLITK
jgi:hypothetical protein